MVGMLKKALKRTPVYYVVRNGMQKQKDARRLNRWEKSGRPLPPPHIVKQQVILDYARRSNIDVLVETGTYHVDMVEAMKSHFTTVYSIELAESLFFEVKRRFKSDQNVHLIHGDSAIEIEAILERLHERAIFWLDGHYSGGETANAATGNPIIQEVSQILSSTIKGHVILIDDARFFDTDSGYPPLSAVVDAAKSICPNVNVEVDLDIIRISS